jgi:UDP-glucose 4-epimerase
MRRERALVTGGGGFIGSNLTRGLLAEGYRVRVFDDFSTGREENLAEVAGDVDVVEGDVLDGHILERAARAVDVIFHLAAIPSVSRSVLDPMRSHQANATGTLAVLVAAKEAGVGRVVYASSSSVYGGIDALPLHEELPTLPISPYGVSKLAGENYCRAFTMSFGIPTISLRYFNVFGPRQDPTSEYAAVIPRFATALLARASPVIYGDGDQSRDFTFIDNVVRANVLAARAGEDAFGRSFNVAHGTRRSLNELLATLRSIIGIVEPQVTHAPPRPGDIRHSQADISEARRVLGYDPTTSFEEGLRRTVEWLAVAGIRPQSRD